VRLACQPRDRATSPLGTPPLLSEKGTREVHATFLLKINHDDIFSQCSSNIKFVYKLKVVKVLFKLPNNNLLNMLKLFNED